MTKQVTFKMGCVEIRTGRNFCTEERCKRFLMNEMNRKRFIRSLVAGHMAVSSAKNVLSRVLEKAQNKEQYVISPRIGRIKVFIF